MTKLSKAVSKWHRQIAEDRIRPQFVLKPLLDGGRMQFALRLFPVCKITVLKKGRNGTGLVRAPTYGALKIIPPKGIPDKALWGMFKRDMSSGSIPRQRYSYMSK